ncbi:MAG TPA: hypothetical protein VFX98_18575, partial [Longimicrobiaceae bacterium]|nr:hypothetical protein [Longimicrobiaceae bacterium]
IRILVGAHEEGHNFSVHGTEWLFEPSDSASGYRNSQMMGISEHFEFVLPPLADNTDGSQADYLYQAGSATDDLWNGLWGIIRTYRFTRSDLLVLPNNHDASTAYAMAASEASTSPMTPGKFASPSAEFMESSPSDSPALEGSADDPLVGPDGGYGESTTTQGTSPFTGEPTYSTEPMEAPMAAAAMEAEMAAVESSDASMQTDLGSEAAYEGFSSTSSTSFNGMCPSNAPVRQFDVSAVASSAALPNGRIVYNSRTVNGGPLYDPSGILYVFTADLDAAGKLRAGVPVEPLVLRARAGDCIQVTLRNKLPVLQDPDGFNTFPMIVDRFNANQVDPSRQVGLHPQLVAFDPTRSDGSKVGFNPRTVVRPGARRTYQWYAGQVVLQNGALRAFPVEYGATNLVPSDRLKHPNKGAIAALIIEPQGSSWQRDPGTRAQATVWKSNGTSFREFVLLFQDDVNLRFGSTVTLRLRDCTKPQDLEPEEVTRCQANPNGDTTFVAGSAIPNLAEAEDPEDSAQKGFNYRTEPLWFRMAFAPNAPLTFTRTLNFRNSLKNSLVGGDPKTPVFTATAGQAVRFRVLEPGGHARNHVFNLHGHLWDELPYNRNSRQIALNPKSELKGAREGHGPSGHFEVIPRNGAGGRNQIPGDYLYRDQASFTFDGGLWGIFRVKAPSGTISPTPLEPQPVEPDPCYDPVQQAWYCEE